MRIHYIGVYHIGILFLIPYQEAVTLCLGFALANIRARDH